MSDLAKNRPTAKKILEFEGHLDSIYHLVSIGDDETFISGGSDGQVVRWSINKPNHGTLIVKVKGSIYTLHWMKDKNFLVVGENNEGIHIIDINNQRHIKSIALGSGAIFSIISQGGFVYVGHEFGELIIINCSDWRVMHRKKISEKSLRVIAIQPKNGDLVIGSSDNFIRVLKSGSLETAREWVAHQKSVFTLEFDRSGDFLLSGSRDARIRRWDCRADYAGMEEINAHLFAVNHLAFSPDGKHFLTCSMDKTIKIWSAENLTLLRVLDRVRYTGHRNSINRVLWLNDDTFVSAGDDRLIAIWNFNKNPAL